MADSISLMEIACTLNNKLERMLFFIIIFINHDSGFFNNKNKQDAESFFFFFFFFPLTKCDYLVLLLDRHFV